VNNLNLGMLKKKIAKVTWKVAI